jgi:hypothetical protein
LYILIYTNISQNKLQLLTIYLYVNFEVFKYHYLIKICKRTHHVYFQIKLILNHTHVTIHVMIFTSPNPKGPYFWIYGSTLLYKLWTNNPHYGYFKWHKKAFKSSRRFTKLQYHMYMVLNIVLNLHFNLKPKPFSKWRLG